MRGLAAGSSPRACPADRAACCSAGSACWWEPPRPTRRSRTSCREERCTTAPGPPRAATRSPSTTPVSAAGPPPLLPALLPGAAGQGAPGFGDASFGLSAPEPCPARFSRSWKSQVSLCGYAPSCYLAGVAAHTAPDSCSPPFSFFLLLSGLQAQI